MQHIIKVVKKNSVTVPLVVCLAGQISGMVRIGRTEIIGEMNDMLDRQDITVEEIV